MEAMIILAMKITRITASAIAIDIGIAESGVTKVLARTRPWQEPCC